MSTTNGEKIVLTVGIINITLFLFFIGRYFEIRDEIKAIERDVSHQSDSVYTLQNKIEKLVPIEKIQLLEEIKKDIIKNTEDDMIFVPSRN